MNRLEQAAHDYWLVSREVRSPDEGVENGITTEFALKILSSAERLRSEHWRLKEHMHVLRYDIIEGNTKWRNRKREVGSISTLPMRG